MRLRERISVLPGCFVCQNCHPIGPPFLGLWRRLRIWSGDQTPLASFEQNDYIAPGAFGERTLADLAVEFSAVRAATIALAQSLKAEAWVRRGTASGKTVSARALAYIIAGHEMHHR